MAHQNPCLITIRLKYRCLWRNGIVVPCITRLCVQVCSNIPEKKQFLRMFYNITHAVQLVRNLLRVDS